MRDILRFIFSFADIKSFFFFFFTAFVCSLGLLLPDSTILLAAKLSVCQNSEFTQTFGKWAQGNVFAAGTTHVELLHFSVLGKVLWVKCLSLFYFKTCSDTKIICVYGLMFFSLRFNVLFPDNYLLFREMVIIVRVVTGSILQIDLQAWNFAEIFSN